MFVVVVVVGSQLAVGFLGLVRTFQLLPCQPKAIFLQGREQLYTVTKTFSVRFVLCCPAGLVPFIVELGSQCTVEGSNARISGPKATTTNNEQTSVPDISREAKGVAQLQTSVSRVVML